MIFTAFLLGIVASCVLLGVLVFRAISPVVLVTGLAARIWIGFSWIFLFRLVAIVVSVICSTIILLVAIAIVIAIVVAAVSLIVSIAIAGFCLNFVLDFECLFDLLNDLEDFGFVILVLSAFLDVLDTCTSYE